MYHRISEMSMYLSALLDLQDIHIFESWATTFIVSENFRLSVYLIL